MTEQHQALPPLEVTVMCNVTIPKWEWKDGKYGRAEGGWLCIERDGDERALIHMYGLYDADTLRLVADVLENPEIEHRIGEAKVAANNAAWDAFKGTEQ